MFIPLLYEVHCKCPHIRVDSCAYSGVMHMSAANHYILYTHNDSHAPQECVRRGLLLVHDGAVVRGPQNAHTRTRLQMTVRNALTFVKPRTHKGILHMYAPVCLGAVNELTIIKHLMKRLKSALFTLCLCKSVNSACDQNRKSAA